MINRGGPTFVTRLQDETGRAPAEVVRASRVVRDGFDLPALYAEIDALDNKIDGQAQLDLYQSVGRLVLRPAVWVLRTATATARRPGGGLAAGARTLEPKLASLLPAFMSDARSARASALCAGRRAGASSPNGWRCSKSPSSCPISRLVARAAGAALDAAARHSSPSPTRFRIGRIEEAARTITPIGLL